MSTCIAMLLNIPVEAVKHRHHDAYREGRSLREILNSYDIPFESFDSAEPHSIDRSGFWLLAAGCSKPEHRRWPA